MRLQIERLRILASYLHELHHDSECGVAKVRLKMSLWYCGTAACALGHACLMPQFNAQGLKLSVATRAGYPIYDNPETHEVSTSFLAASKFFGINTFEAQMLFDANAYPANVDAREVAYRIAALISARSGR